MKAIIKKANLGAIAGKALSAFNSLPGQAAMTAAQLPGAAKAPPVQRNKPKPPKVPTPPKPPKPKRVV